MMKTNFMVAGPWFHGEWSNAHWETALALCSSVATRLRLEFRQNIEAPFFRHYLHGQGDKPAWKVTTFQSGSSTWHTYDDWPPKQAKPTNFYLHADGTLVVSRRPWRACRNIANTSPIRPTRCPICARPISPTYPEPEWRFWEVADQRFVDHRPDVLTFVRQSRSTTILSVSRRDCGYSLYASTSGTDSDFIVKLIDQYREWPDQRHRQQVRRLLCELHERISAADCDGGASRPLSAQLRASRAAARQSAPGVADPAPRARPRFPEGAPPDGAGPIPPGSRSSTATRRPMCRASTKPNPRTTFPPRNASSAPPALPSHLVLPVVP